MQSSVPNLLDFDQEPDHIKNMYGMDHEVTNPFGKQLLAARRMVEKGVRFHTNHAW
jgi:hypothetical protein